MNEASIDLVKNTESVLFFFLLPLHCRGWRHPESPAAVMCGPWGSGSEWGIHAQEPITLPRLMPRSGIAFLHYQDPLPHPPLSFSPFSPPAISNTSSQRSRKPLRRRPPGPIRPPRDHGTRLEHVNVRLSACVKNPIKQGVNKLLTAFLLVFTHSTLVKARDEICRGWC